MKQSRHVQTNHHKAIFQVKKLFSLFVLFLLGGCSLWNGYLDPDYESSRADRLCHPYGECSQGNWVAGVGMAKDPILAKTECQEAVDLRYGNGWWADSVSRGLEIKRCMENKGFTLQP